MTDRVETPRQLAERVGIKERQIRNLIRSGELESIQIGSRVYVPADAWGLMIERKRTRTCPDETKERNSGTLKIA